MATDLGKAYVQIMPSAKGIKNIIEKELMGEVGSSGTSAGTAFGGKLAIAAGAAVAAAGIGKIISSSLSFGAELQQNLGGTEAVFGDFASTIQSQAQTAYKNMGLSASDYMATANKMGSLFRGSGVEQQKALQMTSDAMQRAADVASVMGVDMSMAMESVAGAAKGNFTMMDNLGVAMNATTIEAYALEKGINFKWNTASNAEKAEIAMRMFMERTADYAGNFAKESEGTFSGSLEAMKASWANVMANLSTGADLSGPLNALAQTVSAFLLNNFIPMVGNIITGIPGALSTFISSAAAQMGPKLLEMFKVDGSQVDLSGVESKFSQFATNVQPLVNGLKTALDQIPGALSTMAGAIAPVVDSIVSGLARMDFSGFESLYSSIIPALTAGFQTFWSIVSPAIDGVVNSFVSLWNACQPLISVLSQALMPVFQVLASFIGGIVVGALNQLSFVFDALKVAVQILTPVIQFLVDVFNFIAPVLMGIAQWVGTVIGTFMNLGSAGGGLKDILKSAWDGIKGAISAAGSVIGFAIDMIIGAFSGAGTAVGVLKNVFSMAWSGIQSAINIAKGVISSALSAVNNGFNAFKGVVSGVVNSVKGFIQGMIDKIMGLGRIDLFGAGKAILDGFLGGLKSAWDGVTGFIGGIAGWIAQHKGPISYDKRLLIPAGKAIMNGLNNGLVSNFETVKQSVLGMAPAISNAFGSTELDMGINARPMLTAEDLTASNYSELVATSEQSSVVALLERVGNTLDKILDKDTDVYLDGDKMAQNNYMRQAAIMAREGV